MTNTIGNESGCGRPPQGNEAEVAIVQTNAAPEVPALAGPDVVAARGRRVVVISRDSAEIVDGGAGLVQAGNDVQITNGGAGIVRAGHDVQIRNGGMAAAVAGRDVQITNGGTGFVFAGRDASVAPGPHGGSNPVAVVASGQARVERSFVGVVVARRAELHNSRVLLRLPLLGLFDAAVDLALRAADRALALLED